MKYLPVSLIYFRVALGLAAIGLSLADIPYYSTVAIVLLSAGMVSDFLDGYIARHLKMSTEQLRRMDSTADVIFFMGIAIATYFQCTGFFKSNTAMLLVLLGAEALTYVVCFIKFRKEIATHSIGAKLWSVTLFLTLTELIWRCDSVVLFQICFWVGIVTRLEIIVIILVLKKWTNDVPTFYHAVRLRQGREISRHKLFNG